MSVLIKGGRVLTAADDYVADVYVEGERISLIGESLDVPADRVVDASGKYVLPGCVDPHTHLDMPFGGTVTIDDVESGQTAAAAGGTTCHVDFVIQPQGSTFAEALEEWRGKANAKQVIDMGYHMAVTDLKEGGSLEELAGLPDQGVTSYKLFMAYKGALMVDDETLFRTMEVAADTGALVMVHAENGDAVDVLVKKALAEGHTEPVWHARTRPPETEGEATNRAIQLARVAGCALYVVHVSCAEAVEPIHLAREGEPGPALERGADGHAERDLDRPLRLPLGRPEDARPRRLLEDPERRAGPREPAAHDPRVRRPLRADLAQPDGRAPVHEPGEALRALPAQGHDRRRLRRGRRRLRPREAAHDLRLDPPLEGRLQPLRGHRGDGLARARAAPRARPLRGRRGRGAAGDRAVRGPGSLRRGAAARAGGGARLRAARVHELGTAPRVEGIDEPEPTPGSALLEGPAV